MEYVTGLLVLCLAIVCLAPGQLWAEEAAGNSVPRGEPVALWPGVAPGDKGDIGEEKDTTKHDPKTPPEREVIRLGNVSKPTLTVWRPAPGGGDPPPGEPAGYGSARTHPPGLGTLSAFVA
jgi:hypothetical protein